MFIKRIKLRNFRNYEEQEIDFSSNLNIIYGNNAQGKTNILESIFLCSYGRSFKDKKDKNLILFGKDFSSVEIDYEKIDREGKIKAEISDKKIFYINGVKQNKISDIIGKINIVTFTPDDIEIINADPSKRRKFLDMMISSLKPNYLHLLLKYNKVIEERNNLLKKLQIENKNISLLDVYDEQLASLANEIYIYRKNYIEKIENNIEVIHNLITESGKDKIKIKYISTGNSKETFLENLKKSRTIDLRRGFTGVGIHRDDFVIFINEKRVSVFGSQGQKRTIVLTLKLCELQIVKDEINESPILLLDDFMSELDEKRRKNFLENIKDNQIIITCTDKIDLQKNYSLFFVENGTCKKV